FSAVTSKFKFDNPPTRMAAHYDTALGGGTRPDHADLNVLADALIAMRLSRLRAGMDIAGEYPRIAVIDDDGVRSASAHTGGAKFWLAEMQKRAQGIPVDPIAPDGIRPWHIAVVNPYGEAYSERANDVLLPFITTYLESGGTWIATGGVPFYYRRDLSDT